MLILQSSNSPSPKSRSLKPLKLILGIGALAGILGLGSTLASNIGLNSGAPIEFGQGVAQTTSCDHEVTLAPISTFVNADGGGEFKFTGVALSGLDTTDQSGPSQGCAGKSFTIKVYNKLGVENATSYVIDVGASDFISTAGAFTNVVDFNSEATSATLSFGSTLIAATDVYRITIESSVATVYSVGQTGPGGGIVFYVDNSLSGFTETGAPCGSSCHYLEAAPTTGTSLWTDAEYGWSGNPNTAIGTTSTAIGSGYENTLAMITQDSTADKAGTVAQAYRGPNGLSDWFLPSQDELNALISEREIFGGFGGGYYWSSTEGNAQTAWIQFFTNDWRTDSSKDTAYYVRPIRAF